jgi:hypothetical protein
MSGSFGSGSLYLVLSICASVCVGFRGGQYPCVSDEDSAAARWRTPDTETSATRISSSTLRFPTTARMTSSITGQTHDERNVQFHVGAIARGLH